MASTNDVLRVNQPRAFERSQSVVANGTNVQLVEAAGASTSSSSDAALAGRIKTALNTDTTLVPSATGLKVSAENGKIVLQGVVPTEAQKLLIFEKAQEIAGKNKIENRLQVQTTHDSTPFPDVQKSANP